MNKIELQQRIDNLSPKARKLFLLRLEDTLRANSISDTHKIHHKLVAYVKTADGFDAEYLKSNLKKKLPDYMIPASIVSLDEFPMLPNGKIDKKKLSALKPQKLVEKSVETTNDLTETETKLRDIWEEVLGFGPIDLNDNFFEIGGDSILSIQIIARARKLGLSISPSQLFENQTIASLSKSMDVLVAHDEKWDFLVPLRKEGTKKPLFCIHSGGGHVFFYNLLTEYMKPDRPIYALQSSGLDGGDEMHDSIESMTKDYIKAIREVQPEGPYNVLVYCFSATVGNEMGIQLGKLGQEVNIIVMDTMAEPWTLNRPDRLQARMRSFVIRFFKAPLTSIKTFFIDRFWRISPLWYKLFGSEDEKELERVKINLRDICLAYDWHHHMGKVSLILTEKPHESLQKVTIDSWKKLAKGGVRLFYTKGNHRTLFEKPDVAFVSQKIDESMVD